MTRPIEIISIPSSAGATCAGIEQAPAAILAVGLTDALRHVGCDVIQRNDHLPIWPWRDNPDESMASNVEAVLEYIVHTRERVTRSLSDGNLPLVLGGDCSIEIGVVAANLDLESQVGLIYIDGHADLNVPGSVPDGTGEFSESLDWMGVAHMLGVEGAIPEIAQIGPRYPLLKASDIAVVGLIREQASDFERQQIHELELRALDWKTIARGPSDEIASLFKTWGNHLERFLVHFDVDVLNFTEMPIADTTASRDVGLTLHQTMQVLSTLVADSRFCGIAITEVNPTHSVEDGSSTRALHNFVQKLSQVLSQIAQA
ncbi:MAG: arginase family protein [Cyanobacteriota bacterium]|nr:arginase family protein [Cyanobacteriota bacterium]